MQPSEPSNCLNFLMVINNRGRGTIQKMFGRAYMMKTIHPAESLGFFGALGGVTCTGGVVAGIVLGMDTGGD